MVGRVGANVMVCLFNQDPDHPTKENLIELEVKVSCNIASFLMSVLVHHFERFDFKVINQFYRYH